MNAGRRRLAVALCAALIATTTSASPAAAGGTTDQYFDAMSGQNAKLDASVDAVTGGTVLAATRGWWANYQDQGASAVTNAAVTIASGHPPTGFNANGVPVAAFPLTSTSATVPSGGGIFVGLGSQLPTAGALPFSLSRDFDVPTVPIGGGLQTTTISLTLTDPTYVAMGHYGKIMVTSRVPGASVVSTATPAPSAGVGFRVFANNPNGRTFVLGGGVLGDTYVFAITFSIPNPYGVAFTHKPDVTAFYAYAPPEVVCGACTNAVSIAVPTLDGGTPGAGAMSVTIDQTSTWRTSTTTTFSVDLGAISAPPPPPPPPLCATLADCPFTGPATVASGLVFPNALAIDRRGDLYVSEHPSQDVATLSVLRARDGDDADERDDDDSAEAAAPAGAKTEIYRVTALAPFTAPGISSPLFDRRGDAFVVVVQHVTGDLLHVRRAIVRLDRRTHAPTELFAAEGLDPALGQPASAGITVAADGSVYFGQANVLYRIAPDGGRSMVAAFAPTALLSAPVIEPDGSLVVLTRAGILGELFSVRRNGDVVRIAHVQPTEPGVTPFVYLETDAAGNVFTTQRVPHAFQRFSCAYSTTMRVLRFDGTVVRTTTSEVAPAEVATTTQGGHLGLVGADHTFFRVSAGGDVFFGVYPFVPFCPPAPLPPYPLSNQPAARRAMAFAAQPDGTLAPYALIALPGVTVSPNVDNVNVGTFAFAVRGSSLFVADGAAGTIVRFERQ